MISFVCGQLCSGKTLYSKALSSLTNGIYIEVGDIVRTIKNTSDRKDLQDSKNLNQKIVEILKDKITSNNTDYIISGVRQKEILESFPETTMLWIECPLTERKQRYNNRMREGDNQTFEEAEMGDINLGILQVKQYILQKTL
jgi:cytidylate kinase